MPYLMEHGLVDALMPRHEQRIVKAQPVRAPAERTFAAIRRVDFFQSPIIAVPNRLRVELDQLIGPRQHGADRRQREFRFAQLLDEDGGFQLLAEDAGRELVLGFVGRWWERGYGRVDWAAEDFAEFGQPGCAKGSWGFAVLPYGASTCILVTDVRVCCVDDEARRKFKRYWTLVGPFVAAMGSPVLRLIRDEAERTPTAPAQRRRDGGTRSVPSSGG